MEQGAASAPVLPKGAPARTSLAEEVWVNAEKMPSSEEDSASDMVQGSAACSSVTQDSRVHLSPCPSRVLQCSNSYLCIQ